jgi:hypothetical protein
MSTYAHHIVSPEDDGDDHRHQLAGLGFGAEELAHTVLAGYTRGREITSNHPKIAAGFDTWSEMVAVLREVKCPQGWLKDSTRNYETVRHPDSLCQVAIAGGTHETGTRNGTPHTRTHKGIVTVEVVSRNMQLSLFGSASTDEDADRNRRPPTWLHVHYYDHEAGEIRHELSLPLEMTGKKVTAWEKRVLLPPVPFEMEDGFDDEDDFPDDEPIDVDVPRRPN